MPVVKADAYRHGATEVSRVLVAEGARWLAVSNALPASRVDEVLDLVGLSSVAGQRVGKFSLGMGQRLGIAVALLGDPPVVVLDEPVNGLDPEGIRWVRNLARQLAAEGRTVFVSSHLMSEMALTADHLVVIGRGRIVADGAKHDLLAAAGAQIRTPRPDELVAALGRASITVSSTAPAATPGGPTTLRVDADPARVGLVAFEAGVPLLELREAGGNGLEEMFLELTSDTQRDQPSTTDLTGAAA